MLDATLARRYADAISQIAIENNLVEQFESEFKTIIDSLESEDLRRVFLHPQIPASEKKEIIDQAFADKLSSHLLQFIHLLIDKKRESSLGDIYIQYVIIANKLQNVVEVEVSSVVPLSPENEAKLIERLTSLTGKSIRLTKKIDPELVGGIVIRMGDRVIDGSVVHYLENLKESIVSQY